MNPVFKEVDFWNLFFFLEYESLEEEILENQLELLAKDFHRKWIQKNIQIEGQGVNQEFTVIEFEFLLPESFALIVEYIPFPLGSGKYLHLSNQKTKERHLMGWWDFDAWHPYCLQSEELEQINLWNKNNPSSYWHGTDFTLLMLHDFVGMDQAQKAEKFAQNIFQIYKQMNLEGFDAMPTKPVAVFYQEEEKYLWKKDAELGYLFESPIYNCYSLRNRSHLTGQEKGRFPFELWKKIMSHVVP